MKTDVVPIRMGDNWILVRAEIVSEFLSSTPWLTVPGSSAVVPGVMTWRGRAVPVLDLPRALELGGGISPLNECQRVMILEHPLGVVAVPVDGASEVKTLVDEDVRQPHVTTMPYCVGEVDGAEGIMPIIDMDQILTTLGRVG